MELITTELVQRSKELGTQEDVPEGSKIVIAKLFDPGGGATWLITDLSEYEDYQLSYGFSYLGPAMAHFAEWGTIDIDEIEELELPHKIERDLHWKEKPMHQARYEMDPKFFTKETE